MSLYTEIFEQPNRLDALLSLQRKNVEMIAQEIRIRDIKSIYLAARGTSEYSELRNFGTRIQLFGHV